jgi:hypothetical protein
MADKTTNATLLRDEIGIRRPILIDDLAGTGHMAYGGLPNMTWVIGRGGQIVYMADWTSAAISPYTTEQIEYRDQDREAVYRALERNGPRALAEFERAEEIWSSR